MSDVDHGAEQVPLTRRPPLGSGTPVLTSDPASRAAAAGIERQLATLVGCSRDDARRLRAAVASIDRSRSDIPDDERPVWLDFELPTPALGEPVEEFLLRLEAQAEAGRQAAYASSVGALQATDTRADVATAWEIADAWVSALEADAVESPGEAPVPSMAIMTALLPRRAAEEWVGAWGVRVRRQIRRRCPLSGPIYARAIDLALTEPWTSAAPVDARTQRHWSALAETLLTEFDTAHRHRSGIVPPVADALHRAHQMGWPVASDVVRLACDRWRARGGSLDAPDDILGLLTAPDGVNEVLADHACARLLTRWSRRGATARPTDGQTAVAAAFLTLRTVSHPGALRRTIEGVLLRQPADLAFEGRCLVLGGRWTAWRRQCEASTDEAAQAWVATADGLLPWYDDLRRIWTTATEELGAYLCAVAQRDGEGALALARFLSADRAAHLSTTEWQILQAYAVVPVASRSQAPPRRPGATILPFSP